jgi:predicted dehydrogenase
MKLGLVGCGGMGWRHLYGIATLQRIRKDFVMLEAVVDHDRARAEALANEAEHLLGHRPSVHVDLRAPADSRAIEAVDITTATQSHADLCFHALEASLNVLVEKPFAVTVHQCLSVSKAATDAGRCLAVAENVRREAGYRLARAVVQSGLLGEIRFVVDQSLSGRDAILLTPWRHRRSTGGILLDDGVHSSDVIEYLAGPVARIAASVRLAEPTRHARGTAGPVASASFYQRWVAELPATTHADAEDEAFGILQFGSGARGSWTISRAAHGDSREERWVYGSEGSLMVPPDRSGKSPVLTLDDGSVLEGDALVKATPAYRLEGVSAAVFGGDRPAPREERFAELDRKLIAVELADFIESVRDGRHPEVDAAVGTRNVALVWALFEASLAQAWVDVADVESGALRAYQASLQDA